MTFALAEQTSFEASPTPPPRHLFLLSGAPDGGIPIDQLDVGLDDARDLAMRHPTSAVSQARLAQAALLGNEKEEAIDAARKAIELGDDERALVSAAIVLAALDHAAEAEAALSTAVSAAAAQVYAEIAIARDDFDQAEARLSSTDTPSAAEVRGWLLIRRRKYQDAVRSLRFALAEGPPSPSALINLGYAYGALGDRKKALRTTIEAARLAPLNTRAAQNLVAFLAGSGDYEKALRELGKMRERFPGDIRVLGQSIITYLEANKVNQAKKLVEGARKSRSWWSATPEDRASMEVLISQFDFEQGRVSFGDLLTRMRRAMESQRYSEISIALSHLYLLGASGKREEARRVIGELEKVRPASELGGARVMSAWFEERFDEAAEEALHWVKNDPFNTQAVNFTSEALTTVARYEDALRIIRERRRRLDNGASFPNLEAYSLACLGRTREARQVLSRSDRGNVLEVATLGLTYLYDGQVEQGVREYGKAIKLARHLKDHGRFADAVRLRKELALREVGAMNDPAEVLVKPDRRSDLWVEMLMHEYRTRTGREVRIAGRDG